MHVPADLQCRRLGDGIALLTFSAEPGPYSLTQAERGVAIDLLGGLSNAAIAQRRGVSSRTVANQVAAVFKKVGVGSRAELASRCCVPDLI